MFTHSPRIVTDGLVLCLDAANSKSYPGSGTTITDLSGNGSNGTLTNGPTFNSNNGGNLVFDGVNDYVQVSGGTNFTPNDSFSIFCTFKADSISSPTAVTDNASVIFGKGATEGSHGVGFNYNQITDTYTILVGVRSISNVFLVGSLSYVTGSITNVGITYSPGSCSFYRDGSSVGSSTDASVTESSFDTGDYFSFYTNAVWGGNPRWPVGALYSAQVYNRTLTDDEVLQNYNATKARFGI